jgi:hypothetical protein
MGKRVSGRLIPVRLDEQNYEKLTALARAYGIPPGVMARLLLIQALGRPDLRLTAGLDGERPDRVEEVSAAPSRYYILSEDDLAAIRRMWEDSALRVSRAVRERARQMSPEQAELYEQSLARAES